MRVLYEKLREDNTEMYIRFADDLYEKYIGDKNRESFFLNLSKKDEVFFREYIQKIIPNRRPGKLVSNKNIRKCYEFFINKVNELGSGSPEKIEEICWELKKKIETNLIFVVIDVDKDVDAYAIFESINSKRQGLTISDLLKNYIFSAADQYEKEKPDSRKLAITEDAWDRMEQELDKIEINQYIRHFWISNYRKVFEKELYQQIKNKLSSNCHAILDFFAGVVDESGAYAEIVNANLQGLSSEGLRALEQLKQLRNKQYYPLILSAIHAKLPSDEISSLIKLIASVAVRRALIGKNPNELEDFFADNASILRKKEVTIDSLKSVMCQNFWITDEIVGEEIKTANFEDQEYLAKFILREFEASKNAANEKILGRVSLEHVLPRNPEKQNDWKVSLERQKDLLWNIGNLALIGQEYNNKMSNKSFHKKKPFLKKTEIKTTTSLSILEDWTEAEILKRNSEVASFLIKWWPKN